MKQLKSLEEFSKENSKSILNSNFFSTISGGSSCVGENCEDTWESDTSATENNDTCQATFDEHGHIVGHKHIEKAIISQ